MLKIVFGEVENAVYHPPTYFDSQYEDEWIAEIGKRKDLTINLHHVMDLALFRCLRR